MNKIRAFLISLALFYSVGASAAPVDVDTLSIDDATVSINFGLDPTLTSSFNFNPSIDINMGTFQKNIVEFGSIASGFLLEIYSTGTYGATAPTGTVDSMMGKATFDFSSLRGTITRGAGPTISVSDFSLATLFSNPIRSDYDGATDMVDMLWAEDINIDVFGLSLPASLEIGIKGAVTVSAVPVPAAVWLFGSGMIALFGFSRKNTIK